VPIILAQNIEENAFILNPINYRLERIKNASLYSENSYDEADLEESRAN